MLYFSELDKVKVYSSNQKLLGTLDDLVFSLAGTPYIKKLVIIPAPYGFFSKLYILRSKERMFIPVEYVHTLTYNKIVIEHDFIASNIEENELYVKKNLLDTQVIDIEENNIVRVNDVLIQDVNLNSFVIYGVDIGLSGVLRWLGFERAFNRILHLFKKTVPQYTLAWSDIQPLELSRGRVVLNYRFDKMKNLHPSDLADYLETQNFKSVLALLEGMDKKYLAQVLSELNPNLQIDLFRRIPIDKVAYIVSAMDPDEAVDIISQMSFKKREEILKKLKEKEASIIRRLLKFSRTPLGEFLNLEFLTVYPNETVQDVVKKIKTQSFEFSDLYYLYVINKEGQLIGVFNLYKFLLQSMDTQVFRFMTQRVKVANLNTPVEVAFRRMIKYKISNLPIVDNQKKIIGVVTVEDLAEEVLKRE